MLRLGLALLEPDTRPVSLTLVVQVRRWNESDKPLLAFVLNGGAEVSPSPERLKGWLPERSCKKLGIESEASTERQLPRTPIATSQQTSGSCSFHAATCLIISAVTLSCKSVKQVLPYFLIVHDNTGFAWVRTTIHLITTLRFDSQPSPAEMPSLRRQQLKTHDGDASKPGEDGKSLHDAATTSTFSKLPPELQDGVLEYVIFTSLNCWDLY